MNINTVAVTLCPHVCDSEHAHAQHQEPESEAIIDIIIYTSTADQWHINRYDTYYYWIIALAYFHDVIKTQTVLKFWHDSQFIRPVSQLWESVGEEQ